MAVMMRQMSSKSITLEKPPLEYERVIHERRMSAKEDPNRLPTIPSPRGSTSTSRSSTSTPPPTGCCACFQNPFWKVKALYAFPQLSLLSLTMLINIHVIIFYNEVGVRLSFLSFFQIFSRSFDVLTDPMLAHVSDNLTRTRWGRRKPWISLGAPMYAVVFVFLMSPPGNANPNGTANMAATWWFGASYLLFYLSDTLANIPLFALGPELSDDPEERNGLFMWSKVFEGLGTMSGGAMPILLLRFFPKKMAFQIMAIAFGSWYLVSIAGLLSTVKERESSSESRGLPFVPAIFRAFSNPAFRVLAVSWILDYSALAIFVGVMPFYFNYYLFEGTAPADALFSAAVTVLFISGFICIPFWRVVAMQPDPDHPAWNDRIKIGARNAWLVYNCVNAISNFLFIIIQPRQIVLVFIFSILNGIPVGGQFLMLSMLANVVDYDEFLNHTRQEGTFVVLSTFVPKMAAIPAQSLPLVIIYSLGFIDPRTRADGTTEIFPQNKSVVMFLQIMFAVVPAVMTTISWFVKRSFPIKSYDIMAQISDGIAAHGKGLPATDPITGNSVVVVHWTDEELDDLDLLNHFTAKEKIEILLNKKIDGVKCKIGMWIGGCLVMFCACVFGVIIAWPLLNNQRWAIVPALCCVGIGGSAAAVALNVLRWKAAKEVRLILKTGPRGKAMLETLRRYLKNASKEDDDGGKEGNAETKEMNLTEMAKKESDTGENSPPTYEDVDAARMSREDKVRVASADNSETYSDVASDGDLH